MTNPLDHLYTHRRWRKVREAQLSREPLCRFCLATGKTTAATVCDHIEPHRGNLAAFWRGPFQSLCQSCHSGAKQELERSGTLRGCDAEGWPLDPGHHW